MNDLQKAIDVVFTKTFGRTPLKQRVDDILGEALELHRHTDIKNLKEELGDLLSSAIQGATECGWTVEELIHNNLDKIDRRRDQYNSLGRKLKVAVLGGAFDPPHKGHIAIAKFVLDTSKEFDEVWLMPCYEHMNGKEMTSPEHRRAMVGLASNCDGRIKMWDYEIKNKLRGETYHTVKKIQDEDYAKDQFDFSMIIGLDNANSFDKWVNYEHLEKLIRFVVVSRLGCERDPKVDWYLKDPHIFLQAETEIPEVSSTRIRQQIRYEPNTILIDRIDPEVFKYIKQNKLYS